MAEKLRTTEEKIEEKELLKEEAQGYVQEAEDDNDAAPTDNSPGAPADGSSDVPADNGAGTPEELSSGMILE